MTIGMFQGMVLIFRLLVPLTILLVVGWSAWQANSRDKNALLWGLAAGAAFYIPFRLVREIMTSLLDGVEQTGDNILALTISYHLPPIMVGALTGYLATRFLIARYGN